MLGLLGMSTQDGPSYETIYEGVLCQLLAAYATEFTSAMRWCHRAMPFIPLDFVGAAFVTFWSDLNSTAAYYAVRDSLTCSKTLTVCVPFKMSVFHGQKFTICFRLKTVQWFCCYQKKFRKCLNPPVYAIDVCFWNHSNFMLTSFRVSTQSVKRETVDARNSRIPVPVA